MADLSSFQLHECVYRNDIRQLSSLLRTSDINQKDKHGDFFACHVFKQSLFWIHDKSLTCHKDERSEQQTSFQSV